MKRLFGLISLLLLVSASLNVNAQNFGETPEDSVKCVENYSLYNEFFRQKNYKDAIGPYRNLLQVCPKFSKSIYQNGEKLYTYFIDNEKDEAKKEALIDTLIMLYDKRIEYFGQKAFVLGKKGEDLLKMRPNDPKTAMDVLMESYKLSGKKTGPSTLIYLYKAMYETYKVGQLEKADLINIYPELAEVAEYNIKNPSNEKYVAYYQSALENLEKLFAPVADCPDLIDLFQKKFEADPSDVNMLKTALKLLDAKECTDADIYIEIAKKLNEIEPSAESAYSIGSWFDAKEKYNEAIEYFKQTLELSEDASLQEKAAIKAANSYRKLSQYSSAKSMALKVLSINPNNGNAYILIGDCYAATAKQCGDNECTSKSAYWAAVDKYYRAKQVDESVAETANSRIATYSKYFPKKTDCFFVGIQEGSSYTVGCWINEGTTVRVIE